MTVNSFREQGARDGSVHSLQVRQVKEQRPTGLESAAGGRVLDRDDHLLLHQALAAGEVEGVDAQRLPGLVIQGDTEVVLVQDGPQRLGDLLKESAKVE